MRPLRRLSTSCVLALGLTFLIGRLATAQSADALPVLFVHGWCGGWDSWLDTVAKLAKIDNRRYGPAALGDVLYYNAERDTVLSLSTGVPPQSNPGALVFALAQVARKGFLGFGYYSTTAIDVADVSIDEKAVQLWKVIQSIKTITGKSKVVLVGHSQGGLVSRAYVQGSHFGDDVGAVITIDTPHTGTPLADATTSALTVLARTLPPPYDCMLADTVSRGEMSPASSLLRDLNSDVRPLPPQVEITAIRTTYDVAEASVPLSGANSLLQCVVSQNTDRGDGIVPSSSQGLELIYARKANVETLDNRLAITLDSDDLSKLLFFCPSTDLVQWIHQVHSTTSKSDQTVRLLATLISRYGVLSPGPPQDLRFSAGAGTVSLFWNPPSAGSVVAGYVIEAGSRPGAADLATLETGGTATSYTAAAPPGTYYVRVKAKGSGGLGPPSNEVVVTIGNTTNSFDGTWTGQTGQGEQFQIRVSNSIVNSWIAGWRISGSGCSAAGTASGGANALITNNSFSFSATSTAPSGGYTIVIAGIFSSARSVSGTLRVTPASTTVCQASLNTTWTAQR